MSDEQTAVARIETGGAMSLKQVTDRVNLVHQVLEKVMMKGTHYGTVPGCGEKMVLLKPGADVLAMTFRLVPQFKIDRTDMSDGHREFDVTCSMFSATGELLGQGVGSASTMEVKYRYRWEGGTWDERAKKKVGGKRVENPDIADVYNTVLKIAKKRAHIDATLTVTGAADLFTQDLIDDEDEPQNPPPSMPVPKNGKPPDKPAAASTAPAPTGDVISEKQGKRLFAIATHASVSMEDLRLRLSSKYGIEHSKDILRSDYEAICAWAEAGGQDAPDTSAREPGQEG